MAYNPKPISEPQKKFIRGLCEDRDLTKLPEEQQEFLKDLSDTNLDRLTMKQGISVIARLRELPWKPKQQEDKLGAVAGQTQQTKVREGYFFIVDPTNDEERFFRVSHGKKDTRWEGYVFLDVQASDYFYAIKDRTHREAVLAEIAKDEVKAMNEYGLRLGRCGVCNRTLTDRHSILRGIGPICAAKLGPTEEQENILRQLGLIKEEGETADE
jgi:hypothetical protein